MRWRPNEGFFYLIAAASLMESATDLYTRNLIDFFAGDEEITSWLEHYWLPEELQHGRALRRYVEDRLAGIRLGTRLRALCRGIPAVLRRGAGNRAQPRNGLALRRRDRHRQLLHDLVTRQPRSGAGNPGTAHRRRRGTPLQAFLPFFPALPGSRTPEPRRGRAGIVAALADERRRRQLHRAQACLSRPSSRAGVSTIGCTASCGGRAAILSATIFRTKWQCECC